MAGITVEGLGEPTKKCGLSFDFFFATFVIFCLNSPSPVATWVFSDKRQL